MCLFVNITVSFAPIHLILISFVNEQPQQVFSPSEHTPVLGETVLNYNINEHSESRGKCEWELSNSEQKKCRFFFQVVYLW